jgi:hypothetical protein
MYENPTQDLAYYENHYTNRYNVFYINDFNAMHILLRSFFFFIQQQAVLSLSQHWTTFQYNQWPQLIPNKLSSIYLPLKHSS